jgi:hypothetical protein
MLIQTQLSQLPGNTSQERNSPKKDQKLIIWGYTINNHPNYGPQGNIAGTSVEVIQVQNFMLNLNLRSKLPGNNSEERNSWKKIDI